MKKLGLIASAAVAAALTLGGAVANAQPFTNVQNVSGWSIFKNEATGGCFMERQTAEGVVLQVGSLLTMLGDGSAEGFGYLGVYAPGPGGEVSDSNPAVLVEIGPNAYIGQAHRQVRDGFHGGYIVSNNDNLASDLRNRNTMTGTTSNGAQFIVDLRQTDINNALDRVIACQS